MIYSLPGTVVISYLGGTFGNALAALVIGSQAGRIRLPNKNTFHTVNWPIESIDCTITKDSIIRFKKEINTGDVIQLHCLNAKLIAYKFPDSRCIMLDCSDFDQYFGIQRQWLVNNQITSTKSVDTVLSAWNWIKYNLNYYNDSGKINQFDKVLCLDFKSVIDKFELIEDYLSLTFSKEAKNVYILHYQTQMEKFYIKNINFEFAWDVFNSQGSAVPIRELAKDFVS
jgi:hypothetical protein